MMRTWLLVVLCLGGLISFGAPVSGQTPEPAPEAEDTSESDEASPEAADEDSARSEQEEARRARLYARIGEDRLTVGDIEDAIAREAPFMRTQLRQPSRLAEYANRLLRERLMAREADRRDFDEHVAARHSYKEALVQTLVRKAIDEEVTRESITEEAIAAYYEAHPQEFRREAMVRAAHILFDTEEEARAVLEEARAADARTFRSLVRRHSVDTETRDRGGDLRFFFPDGRHPDAPAARSARDQQGTGARENDPTVHEALVTAAFALSTLGEVSEPIPVNENFSLVKLTGRREEEVRSLAQASDSIRVQLWRERRQDALDEMVRSVRQGTTISLHPEKLRAIHLDSENPAAAFPAHEGEAANEPDDEATEAESGAEDNTAE